MMELIEIMHSLSEIMSLNFPSTLLLMYSSVSFTESQDYKNEKESHLSQLPECLSQKEGINISGIQKLTFLRPSNHAISLSEFLPPCLGRATSGSETFFPLLLRGCSLHLISDMYHKSFRTTAHNY